MKTGPESDHRDDDDRGEVDYERYEAEYSERLDHLNRDVATAPHLDWRDLDELLVGVNAMHAPDRVRDQLPRSLRGRLRKAVVRIVRWGLADELANLGEFNAQAAQALNRLREALDQFAVRQREYNVTLANFGQKVVPVMDGKVQAAYRTLDRIICDATGMLMNRMDLVFTEFDGRQEMFENRLEGVDQGMTELNEWLHNTRDIIQSLRDEVDRAIVEFRHGLRLQHAKLERLGAAPAAPTVSKVDGAPSREQVLDDFAYFQFEELHRGAPADLRSRFASYVPLFTRGPVMDLGCGRGEFMELMTEHGIEVHGVDLNTDMAATCVAKGLKVTRGDAMDHLRALPDGALAGIFSAQLVEHLKPVEVMALIREAHRTLEEDGILLIETINPASFHALSHSFFLDPTHIWPVHPDTLTFLLHAAGFSRVEILPRSPVPDETRLPRLAPPAAAPDELRQVVQVANGVIDQLNDILYGFGDYAAVARI
ncbi:methyltransferase domain-containing protein [bacterium]|nr:methyltransferase domain-containing protein [candidate division CSSED10-310 bacterium]